MSLAAALATASHHSAQPYAAPRGQTTGTKAREGEVREQYYGPRAPERPLPGMRPAPLSEVLPQVGLQRHTVEQRIVHTPYVQILGRSCAANGGTAGGFLQGFGRRGARARLSQCPRSLWTVSLSAQWTSFRRWRNSWWKCRPCCLLPFSSSGLLSSSLPFLFLVVVMVVFQGLSQDKAQQRLRLSRLLTFLLPVEIFKVFAQERVQQRFQSRTFPLQLHVVEVFVVVSTVFLLRCKAPQWIFQFLLGTLMKGFFALFPGLKKVRRLVAHSRSALAAHSSSSTLMAW